LDMQQGQSARTCSIDTDVESAHTARKCMPHGQATGTCSMDKQHGDGSMDMQHGYSALTCSTEMKHDHAA
jgi:hypothetical protein